MIREFFLSLSVSAACSSSVIAGSYAPISDSNLLKQSELVIIGQVSAVRESQSGSSIYTDYDVAVNEVLKGSSTQGTITLRMLGSRPGGIGIVFEGVPHFEAGARGLWFLEHRQDGTFGVLHLALGAFREVETNTGETALFRNLEEMTDVTSASSKSGEASSERPRSLRKFANWLKRSARGERSDTDYMVEEGTEVSAAPFTFFGSNPRWFVFDQNQAVTWVAVAGGYAPSGNGIKQLQTALKKWTAHSGTNINYVFGGTVPSASFDCRGNDITWDDPANDIAGTFSCNIGGVLAIGGFCTSGSGQFKGATYANTVAGQVLTQDGAGCFFDKNGGKNGEEVLLHELGHTLGLAHSCGDSRSPSCSSSSELNEAIMRASAHGDGRGASLGKDDKRAIKILYPKQ